MSDLDIMTAEQLEQEYEITSKRLTVVIDEIRNRAEIKLNFPRTQQNGVSVKTILCLLIRLEAKP